MKIVSYEARGGFENDLHFCKMRFGKLNLIVGDSATGKTRLLNTIFNGGKLVARKDEFYLGMWDMTFEHNKKTYRWRIETGKRDDVEQGVVLSETVLLLEDNTEKEIIARDESSFVFNGQNLPKLSPHESAVSLLQKEELVRPLYEGLSSIMRRNFSGPDLEMEAAFQAVPQSFLQRIKKKKDLDSMFPSALSLSAKLYVLSLYFSDVYKQICDQFLAVFPFVAGVKILDAEQFNFHHPGMVPVFSLKEKDIDVWIPLKDFSSGMRKVLLILTDIFTLPRGGGVYLIDEYENSLGINAINFFPSILLDADTPGQFIVTSHHPYIIGNVPVKNWIVLRRQGTEVQVKQGEELEERFSKSKQQAFIQLINDPFYSQGVV